MLPSASHRVRYSRAAVAFHRQELDVLRCRTSLFARCLLPAYDHAFNGLPDAVFESVRWVASGVVSNRTVFSLSVMYKSCSVAPAI